MVDITLVAAFAISDNVESRDVRTLFWAADRLVIDLHTIEEGSKDQRRKGISRLAEELQRRRVPMRAPDVVARAMAELRLEMNRLENHMS